MKQKTVLVTGGAGYIGSKISYDLIDKKFKVKNKNKVNHIFIIKNSELPFTLVGHYY